MHAPVPPGWMPASPCTQACLPAPARPSWTQALRLAAVAAVLLTALATVPFAGNRWLATCCRALLRATGVRLRVTPARAWDAWAGVLVVANHLSWIDVVALTAVAPVRLLAKCEVGGWPLIGGLARRSGALFVDRAGLRALPGTVAGVADALRAGHAVAVFPEGTTWCGAAAGPFRRAVFQAALDAGVPVRPVAITFRPVGTAAFVGAQTLLDSVLRVVRTPGLTCELTLLADLAPAGDRRALARRAETTIASATGVPHVVRGALSR